jgi:hypothetical protein
VDEIFARALDRSPERRPHGVLQWAEEAAAALEQLTLDTAGWNLGALTAAVIRLTPAHHSRAPAEEATRLFGDVDTRSDR